MSVILRTDSITETILGSTEPVIVQHRFVVVDFFFASPVTVTPGTTYYFQPVVQAGNDTLTLNAYAYGYPGGGLFLNSSPGAGTDLWFREGIVVPEPSAILLCGLGIVALYFRRKLASTHSRQVN